MATMRDYGTNVAGLQRALRSLPGHATTELRDASVSIAADIASDAQGRASSAEHGAWSLLGGTIRATRDRVPSVALGSSARIPGRRGARQTVGDLTYGLEFGGRARPTTMQFLPHLGTTGYVLWPTVRDRSEQTQEEYSAALQRALEAI